MRMPWPAAAADPATLREFTGQQSTGPPGVTGVHRFRGGKGLRIPYMTCGIDAGAASRVAHLLASLGMGRDRLASSS